MKVCFYTPSALSLFAPSSRAHFGGAEVRATRFARGLAKRSGFEVVCLVRNEGQPPLEVDGLCVVPEPPRERERRRQRKKRPWIDNVYIVFRESAERIDAFPWVRMRRLTAHLLWQVPLLAASRVFGPLSAALRRLLPGRPRPPEPILTPLFAEMGFDLVCVFGASETAASVIASCRASGVPSVLLIASDVDLAAHNYRGSIIRGPHCDSGHLCHLAITEASAVVAQTEIQQRLLADRFGREATVIRNPLPMPPRGEKDFAGERFALWIGRAERANKRPELCLDLARRVPEVPLVMVLNRSSDEVFDEICAAAPPNVTIVERVPFAEIDAYFGRAAVFLNTSVQEGFPNTFLQAASHATPILSLKVDPDGFIRREGCGIVADDDVASMAAGLRRIWSQPAEARRMGEAGRRYVEHAHEISGRIDELAALLRQVGGDGSAGPELQYALPGNQRDGLAA